MRGQQKGACPSAPRLPLAGDPFQPCSPCANVAVFPPASGGPSDLGGLDSSERVASFGVGWAGRGAFGGQV